MTKYRDRHEAGRILADALRSSINDPPIIVGLARGGVPVACAVAQALNARVEVMTALRIPIPGQPEHAVGAIAPGVRFFDQEIVRELEISENYLNVVAAELEKTLSAELPLWSKGRHVVIVDDGIASGATAAAAIQSVRMAGAERVTMCAPVASRRGLELVRSADNVIVPLVPESFAAVSECYEQFPQLSDDDVVKLLMSFSPEPRPA